MDLYAYAAGIAALLAIWLIVGTIAGVWNPVRFIQGADVRPSTSKAQWWLWIVVVLFSYVAIYAARLQRGHPEAIGTIPTNVLVALGLSTATMAVAKGITASQVASGRLAKSVGSADLKAIFQDDAGFPDLSKLQIMAWTFVSIAVYLLVVGNRVHSIVTASSVDPATGGLPDIDGALLALMGIGHGGYIAKKLLPPGPAIAPAMRALGGSIASGDGREAVSSPAGSRPDAGPFWHS